MHGMKRLLIIAESFPPRRTSGSFRIEGFFKYLPEFGIQPAVFTASSPTLEPYPGCDFRPPSHRVFNVPWYSPGKRWNSFSVKAFLRAFPVGWWLVRQMERREILRRLTPSLLAAVSEFRPDAVLASGPPPVAYLLGELLHDALNIPLILDFRDPWSAFHNTYYRHWVDYLLERRCEARLLRKAALILANTPTSAKLFRTLLNVSSDKLAVLTNGYDEAAFVSAETIPPIFPPNHFTILYSGVFTRPDRHPGIQPFLRFLGFQYQPLRTCNKLRWPGHFLDALKQVLNDHPDWAETLRVVFVGCFSQEICRLLKTFPIPSVITVRAPVSETVSVRMMLDANLLLLLQVGQWYRGRDFLPMIPGKLYSYLRSGTPILAPVQKSDIWDLIRQFDAGDVMEPTDVHAIAEAIKRRYLAWQQRGAIHRLPPPGIQRFERRELTRRLSELLHRLWGSQQSSPSATAYPTSSSASPLVFWNPTASTEPVLPAEMPGR